MPKLRISNKLVDDKVERLGFLIADLAAEVEAAGPELDNTRMPSRLGFTRRRRQTLSNLVTSLVQTLSEDDIQQYMEVGMSTRCRVFTVLTVQLLFPNDLAIFDCKIWTVRAGCTQDYRRHREVHREERERGRVAGQAPRLRGESAGGHPQELHGTVLWLCIIIYLLKYLCIVDV